MATRSNANKGVTGRNSNVPPPARNTQDNTQAIRRVPGMAYGEQQELVEQQQAAPLPKDTTPQQPTQRRPFTPTNVFAPTTKPEQPITDGAPMGPGRMGQDLTQAQINDQLIVALATKFPTSDLIDLLNVVEEEINLDEI